MPANIFPSAELEVCILNRAFNDRSPSNAVFQAQKVAAGTTAQSWNAFAVQYGAAYQNLTEGAMAVTLLTNMGLQSDIGLQGALVSYLQLVGKSNVGLVALQLGQILTGLETATGEQAVYRDAAVAWNQEIAAAYVYSTSTGSGSASQAKLVGLPEAHADGAIVA